MSASPAIDELEDEEETTAGNYFVSNYPPYSFWTVDQVPAAHAALERQPKEGTPLGVYLHIPFCRKRCHFCYFKVYTDKNAAEIHDYLDTTIRELELYADKPFIAGRKPTFVYFGGGTPSYLSARQLTSLTDRMKALLPWDEAEEITFECEPGTLTETKLQVIREVGVTRLSLGVENFDEEILRANGRAHGAEDIDRAFDFARAAGFPQINIDLISGMIGETEDNWQQCVRRTIGMQPDSVTIYQMEVPFNTTIYKEMKAQGKITAPVATWAKKREWVHVAFAELEQAGYTVTSAYTVVKDPAKTRFVYRDRLWTGADMIGLGVASFSHVGGTHYQNLHDFVPYLQSLREGSAPIYRALTPTEEELVIREMILQMKLGSVNSGYFRRKFGVEILERFSGPFSSLVEGDCGAIVGEDFQLNREGLMQVDRLLHDFFLPQHQEARYA